MIKNDKWIREQAAAAIDAARGEELARDTIQRRYINDGLVVEDVADGTARGAAALAGRHARRNVLRSPPPMYSVHAITGSCAVTTATIATTTAWLPPTIPVSGDPTAFHGTPALG
mgnify:CR=1 FL=1